MKYALEERAIPVSYSRNNVTPVIIILATLSHFLPAVQAQPGAGPTAVAVAPIVERDVAPTQRLVGSVLPDRAALVASEVSGIVAGFPATEGQFLRKGELICQLDATRAELTVQQARGLLGSLQAKLAELENGTRAEDLRRWQAAWEEASAVYEKWKFERERIRGLYEARQSSDKEWHDVQMEFLAAERRQTQTSAQFEAARNGPRREEIDAARHDVAAQEAMLRNAERDRDRMAIAAPFDGFVVRKRSEIGEWLEAGGAVAEMVAVESVKVRVDAPERVAPFVKVGAAARVELEALREQREGRIARVIPMADMAARTFPIEIDLPNADHRIMPGMFAWVATPSGPTGRRLMAKRDAVVSQGSVQRVFVVRETPEGMLATPIVVRTGIELADEIELISDELKDGELVVCRANERLMGPTPVAPQPLTSAGATATRAASQ